VWAEGNLPCPWSPITHLCLFDYVSIDYLYFDHTVYEAQWGFSKSQKDKRHKLSNLESSPITYITKYTIEHYTVALHKFIVNIYSKWRNEEEKNIRNI
jgi:hypothetical protein